MAIKDEYVALIKKYAQENVLEPSLVAAICMQESGFEPWRSRYEPTWSYFVSPVNYSRLLGISTETEIQMQKTSVGLCQIMGGVARELGFDDYISKLARPDLGIQYGCKKLYQLKKKYDDIKDVIAAYNAGTPNKDTSGKYKNEQYVQNVLTYKAQYRDLDQ